MESNILLSLDEDYLKSETIWLRGEGYDSTPREDFESYDTRKFPADLMISVNRDTGQPLVIVVEGFKTETEGAVKALREYPLPWTFSLQQMGIKEKPLEDLLLAVWKKYRNVKLNWED